MIGTVEFPLSLPYLPNSISIIKKAVDFCVVCWICGLNSSPEIRFYPVKLSLKKIKQREGDIDSGLFTRGSVCCVEWRKVTCVRVCVNLNFFFIICHIDNTDADKFCGLVGELRTVNLLCCLRNVQCIFVGVFVCVSVANLVENARQSVPNSWVPNTGRWNMSCELGWGTEATNQGKLATVGLNQIDRLTCQCHPMTPQLPLWKVLAFPLGTTVLEPYLDLEQWS